MTERTSDSRSGYRITGGWEETCLLSLRPPPRPRVWSLGGPRLIADVTLDLVPVTRRCKRRLDGAADTRVSRSPHPPTSTWLSTTTTTLSTFRSNGA
ncbi:hypothetical protein C0Q70_05102 [Pomacea canaliculata]|uniref:Uncharacterized protein n=1 Tax=Pomacea canaliculata TaxID=400727 RepID=A0A2T7PK79_POMCA|nr:hypothetical protein C0Q70_05102 [Pomacea canaliculata]